jgi:hypothetical protein
MKRNQPMGLSGKTESHGRPLGAQGFAGDGNGWVVGWDVRVETGEHSTDQRWWLVAQLRCDGGRRSLHFGKTLVVAIQSLDGVRGEEVGE